MKKVTKIYSLKIMKALSKYREWEFGTEIQKIKIKLVHKIAVEKSQTIQVQWREVFLFFYSRLYITCSQLDWVNVINLYFSLTWYQSHSYRGSIIYSGPIEKVTLHVRGSVETMMYSAHDMWVSHID